ncbi:MAG TPA: hypothetical protein VFV98_05225 [Vicinamibacterales bacterium]|nr:hypothetical protein [Vicinamibacterales bacterium]
MRRGAVALILVLAAIVAVRAWVAWSHGTYLSYAEGTWSALAQDAARGEWYRPISASTGYGGTRYWPLVFGVHAQLLRVWPDILATGFLMSVIGFAAALAAGFAAARALGLSRDHAVLAVALFAASQSVHYGLLAIRGDLLPLALLLAAVACARRSPPASAALLALAIAGKPTMAYGAVIIAAALALARDSRALAAFAAALAVCLVATLAAMQWLSDGRALPLLLSGTAAGGGWRDLVHAPIALARGLRLVPETALTIAAGAVLAVAAVARPSSNASPSDDGRRLAALWFACALTATLAVFATPGAWLNHFGDLQAASAILIAFAAADTVRSWRVAGAAAASLALAAGVVIGASRAAGADRSDRLASYRAVIAWLDRHPGEILADQPMIPVLAGRRPFIIDSFIFRVNVAADPTRLQPLLEALAARRFVAIVVDADATAATPDGLMLESEFGPEYIRALRDNYRVDSTIWGRSVLVPRR